jgi:uncharacterized protein (TIGR03083 family)
MRGQLVEANSNAGYRRQDRGNKKMIRDAYNAATACFVDTVAQVGASQWEQPGLGVWTVRDLVGHTSRALLTVETYIRNPAAQVDLQRPVDYFLRAMESLADPAAVAARGREAGRALGAEPVQMVREIATRVLQQIQAVADTTLVSTPVGGMQLIDYLPSRVFELVVHTLDLATALSLEMTVPATAITVTLHVLADLAAQQPGKAAPLLLAATGRCALPDAYSVL